MNLAQDKYVVVGPSVEVATEVVLSDGATLNVKVRVMFKTTAQPDVVIKTAVSDFFHGDGNAQGLTVSKFVNDGKYSDLLIQKLKGLSDSSNASLVGFSVLTQPIPGFAEKSKQVTAILKSGETVRLTFGAPSGQPPAPGASEMGKAYELLSGLTLSQLGTLQKQLNDKLLPPNNGWGYIVLSLEVLNCPCKAN